MAIRSHLISALINLNRVEEASRLNQEPLSANPADPHALTAQGRILIAQHKYAEAKTELDRAVQSDPQSAAASYFLGVAQGLLGLRGLAKESFIRASGLSPDWEDPLIALADIDVREGDYDNALRLAQKVRKNNPDSVLANTVADTESRAKGDFSEAEEDIEAALNRNPLSAPSLEAMLDLKATQGKIHEATQRITALLSQYPRNASLYSLLASAYFRQGDLDKAEGNIKRAIALDPKTADAYGILAEISRARGALDQAVTWYQEAIKQNPNKPENYMALADVYGKERQWDAAKRAAEGAHSIDPGSPFIDNNLAFLYLEHGGDINVALSLAQAAKQKLPDSPVASDTLGWAYYKAGSSAAAVAQLSDSVRLDPNNPVYNYHLGMVYMSAGRPREAAQSLKRALASSDFPFASSAKMALNEIDKTTR
jgi:tetratricopeptide (TPR) repeat protein